MIPNVGPFEFLLVLLIALLVFGPKRFPELGRSLGQGLRGFKRAVSGEEEESVPSKAGIEDPARQPSTHEGKPRSEGVQRS
ncbi:MAG TPA: twin-arginine translocase TatA/TatE family subunit [Solirubrobacterales bacterium]